GVARLVVAVADVGAGAGLDHDLVAARGELADGGREQADAELEIFDFLGDADAHADSPGVERDRADRERDRASRRIFASVCTMVVMGAQEARTGRPDSHVIAEFRRILREMLPACARSIRSIATSCA